MRYLVLFAISIACGVLIGYGLVTDGTIPGCR